MRERRRCAVGVNRHLELRVLDGVRRARHLLRGMDRVRARVRVRFTVRDRVRVRGRVRVARATMDRGSVNSQRAQRGSPLWTEI